MSVVPTASVNQSEAAIALPRHALAATMLRCTFVLLEFLGGIVLARTFLASGYGVYATVMSCVAVLAIPATAGLDRYLVRELAVYRTQGEWSLLRGLVRRGFQVTLGVSLVIASLAAAIVLVAGTTVPASTRNALLIGLAIVPLVSMARLRSAVLQGMGKVLTGALPEFTVLPGMVLALALVVFVLPGISRDPMVAVGINAVATLAALGCGTWLLHRATPSLRSRDPPRYLTKRWVAASLPMAWVVGMNLLIVNADVILLGALDSSESAGIYRIAAQMAAAVALPLGAVNAVLAPRIAAAYSAGQRDELQRLTTRSARIVISLTVPIAVVLLLLGGFALALYGADFAEARAALNVLVFGQLVNAATGIAGYLLIMTRYERLAAMLFGSAALANIAMNLFLIPKFGVMGAAIASCATIVFLTVSMAVTVANKLDVRVMAFGWGRK